MVSNLAQCSVCCGSDPQDCSLCEGSGSVLGTPPNQAGWWHVRYGNGKIGLLEVTENLTILNICRKGTDVSIQYANWNDLEDEAIVEWGPKIEFQWTKKIQPTSTNQ